MADIERAELLRTWVSALRSGKYVQGFGALAKVDGSFCALGVLVDIERPDWVPWLVADWDDRSEKLDIPEIFVDSVYYRAGLGLDAGWISFLNDGCRLSLAAIADRIEERYPDVFGDPIERAVVQADADADDPCLELVHG